MMVIYNIYNVHDKSTEMFRSLSWLKNDNVRIRQHGHNGGKKCGRDYGKKAQVTPTTVRKI